MKKILTLGLISASALLFIGCAQNAPETLAEQAGVDGVTHPATGVMCDTYRHFCVDQNGPSDALTEKYLGRRMEMDNVSKNGWLFSNGTSCVQYKRECYKNVAPLVIDYEYTAKIFGRKAF